MGRSRILHQAFKENISEYKRWRHPGEKLRDIGPKELTTGELLAILISTGTKGRSAEDIAKELLSKFGTLQSLSHLPLSALLSIKGLGDVKIIRIAAALELARRASEETLTKYGKKI